MRIPAVLLLAVSIANPSGAQPSKLDVPVEGRFLVADPAFQGTCGCWRTVAEVARRVRVQVGFENMRDCPLIADGAAGEQTLSFDGMTPRAAFNRIVELRPEFSWKEVDGVVWWWLAPSSAQRDI